LTPKGVFYFEWKVYPKEYFTTNLWTSYPQLVTAGFHLGVEVRVIF
jgi:hypothetical protein